MRGNRGLAAEKRKDALRCSLLPNIISLLGPCVNPLHVCVTMTSNQAVSDGMALPVFRYRGLGEGEIRLLILHPGTGTDGISCIIREASLHDPPYYEALSYCWGDANQKAPILCNQCPVRITKSLHSALLALRHPAAPRIIWADAICINQEDTLERAAQVKIMKEIYAKATSAVIWLGGPVEVDNQDIWPIPDLLEAAEMNLKRSQLPIRGNVRNWMALKTDWMPNGDLDVKRWRTQIKGLLQLLERPWFLRVWVIQEIALASKAAVLCGSHSAPWDDFYRAISYAIDLGYVLSEATDVSSPVRYIQRTRSRIAAQQYQRPLELLAMFRLYFATDPRDKVFALYSLFDPSDLAKLVLQPNYNLKADRIYLDAAIDIINLDKSLDFLSFAGNCRDNCILPSWVPDWSFRDPSKAMLPRFRIGDLFGEQEYSASWKSATKDSHADFELSEDRRRITLSGCYFDRVVQTGSELNVTYKEILSGPDMGQLHSSQTYSFWSIFKEWEDICGVPDGRQYVTGEAAKDVYWKTLHAGTFPYGDEATTKAGFETWYKPIQAVASFEKYSHDKFERIRKSDSLAYKVAGSVTWLAKSHYKLMENGFAMEQVNPNRKWHRMLAEHRIMIRTEHGFVGLASSRVREGDHVVLLCGSKMPQVLREAPEEEAWKHVSDSYVHGIMNGECFEPAQCSKFLII